MKKIVNFLVIAVMLLIVVGCQESTTVVGITISSENNIRVIKENDTLQLSATVYFEGANQTVTWSSADSSIASVDQTGLVTAVSVGNVFIHATSTENENITQKYALIVEKADKVQVVPTSIELKSLDDKTSCKVGETITLTATVLPEEASQSIVWTSSDNSIAKVTRGVVKPYKEGKVTIKATSRNYESVYSEIELSFEKSDNPALNGDWVNMENTSHETFMNCEDGTKIKVTGVVTQIAQQDDESVSYFIQNDLEGFYVYSQSSELGLVELGHTYEVGGFKKYYKGLNEICDVEYFVESDENISFYYNNLDGKNPTDLVEMSSYQSSFVTGTAVLTDVSTATKAYNFTANVNGYETTFRVDPNYCGKDEFELINQKLASVIPGVEFEFVGIMISYGNSTNTVATQIQVVKASDLEFADISTTEILNALISRIEVTENISFSVENINLISSIAGFENVVINWTSNSDLISVSTGEVKHSTEDVIVTLTVKLSLDGEELSKEFDVKVEAVDNATYEVLASLDLEDAAAPTQSTWGNSPTKQGYQEGIVNLGNPKHNWLLRNALIAATSNDRYLDTLSIRARSNASVASTGRIELLNDDEYNVIEFVAAVYGGDALGTKIRIEYSTDQGQSWVVADTIVSIDSTELLVYRVKLPAGVKRVAIVIVEGSSNRVNIDNIKYMK